MKNAVFDFKDSIEQVPDWQDSLIVDVENDAAAGTLSAFAAWNSTVPGENASWRRITDGLPVGEQHSLEFARDGDALVATLALPGPATKLDVLGDRAKIRFTVRDRTPQART